MKERLRIQRWSSFTSFSTMDRGKRLRCWYSVLFTLVLMHGLTSSEEQSKSCAPSRCGIITNISHPFRLQDDPPDCGDPIYELACENSVTLLHLYSGTYRVLEINYNKHTIRLVDPGIQKGNCSSLPRYLLSQSNFTDTYGFSFYGYDSRNPYNAALTYNQITFKHVVYLKCRDAVRDDAAYLDTASCVNWEGGGHLYAVAGDLTADQLKSQCRVKSVATIASDWECRVGGGIKSYTDIHAVLSFGFELSWWQRACVDFKCPSDHTCDLDPKTLRLVCDVERLTSCYGPMGITGGGVDMKCSDFSKLRIVAEDYLYGMEKGLFQIARKEIDDHHDDTDFILTNAAIKLGLITGKGVVPYIIVRFSIGIILLSILLIYTYRRRHMSMFENIEDFIRFHNLILIRYSYKDLKTITKGFSNKLGEGGFGTVYKETLRSGYDVAIKMLGKSKANGQEFISEVATIGRIHHVNVVNLVGFCVEGTRRALVYEFMSKGSLDKYIFSKQESISLSYHKIHEISVGVARGIDYLHHGCDMQILHFDIKPQNILLDDNFVPKISDFGLARLYHIDESSVTLTAPRGTIGYMAPELFYKNIGRVSYKTDVYSFGMLLMEMASRRRNLNPHCEHSSQLYFPLWIYDQFDEEKDIEMEDLIEEEKNLAKKMFIVALCCIQLKPDDHSSMSKVIEMLEANDVSRLEMPPKPFLYPNEQVLVNDGSSSSQATSTNSVHYSLSSSGEGAGCGT